MNLKSWLRMGEQLKIKIQKIDKQKMKRIILGLPFLILPFATPNSNLVYPKLKIEKKLEVYGMGNDEKNPPAVSQRFDDYYSVYENDFIVEKNFWLNVFNLDSSYSVVYNLNTMGILDIIDSYDDEIKKEIALDSICKAKGVDRFENPIGVKSGRREQTKITLSRAFEHLDYIIDSLEAHCLPNELAVLPFVESGYRNDVRSYAGAVGMWQFMKAAARENGLKVNRYVDERKDPKKSLSAAIKYLETAHEKFDNPVFALISYNTGMNSRYFYDSKNKNYFDVVKSMGSAPRNYFPAFLAGLEILKNPYKYYPELEGEL